VSIKNIILSLLVFSDLKANESEKQLSHFVWSFGLENICDVGFQEFPHDFFAQDQVFDFRLYDNIQTGDIVWLPGRFVEQFAYEVFPNISQQFALLINDARGSDESFPSDCFKQLDIEQFIADPRIIHIFAQNCDYQGSSGKVSHIPIGIDYHTIGYRGGGWGEKGSIRDQEEVLEKIIALSKPTKDRKKLAFVDFHHSDTMHAGFNRHLQFGEDRKSIFQKLLSTKLVEHGDWMKRYALWQKKSEYAFSISPHGNGLDTHRTWEDLVLGCIVIVKSSPLDPLYEGLPVVIVNDWSEITSDNLDKWLELYGDALSNPIYRERLTHEYWSNKIFQTVINYKRSD
jgi:hypothetical protein